MSCCKVPGCSNPSVARRLCQKHYARMRRHGSPYTVKIAKRGTGNINKGGYRTFRINGKLVYEHRLVAERALGRSLKPGEVVHHVNGDGADNRPENLVICPNQKYHHLLHKRQEALDACGNPDWRKCSICKRYDSPDSLYISEGEKHIYHLDCMKEYRKSHK